MSCKVGEEYCACVRRRRTFEFSCGKCTWKFVVQNKVEPEMSSNNSSDSPGIQDKGFRSTYVVIKIFKSYQRDHG